MKFNEKLINLRKEKGLSQEEFGNILAVSRQSVSKWELGQVKPDVDKIKVICEFYNVTFDYLLNDNIEEKIIAEKNCDGKNNDSKSNYDKNNDNENNKDFEMGNSNSKCLNKVSKMKVLKIILQTFLFIIFAIYIISCSFKAVVFSRILAKNDEDNIESYKYSLNSPNRYGTVAAGNKILTDVSEYVCYKDNIYYVWDVYSDEEENCTYWEQYWNYYDKKFDHKGYHISTKIKDAIWEYDYYYIDKGNFLGQDSTFKFVSDELKKEFTFSNIFNPFKFYKITEDGNIVIEEYPNENYKYSKYLYYIDLKTGFLSKEEYMQNEEIIRKIIYEGYEINTVEDKDLMFDEKTKQEIIEKSKITEEKNKKKYEEQN